jgi:hypothetical protein
MQSSSIDELKKFFTHKSKARDIRVVLNSLVLDSEYRIVLGEGLQTVNIDNADTKIARWTEVINTLKQIDPSLYKDDKVCLDTNSECFSCFGMITDAGNFYLFDETHDLSVNFKASALDCFALFNFKGEDKPNAVLFTRLKDNAEQWSISIIKEA